MQKKAIGRKINKGIDLKRTPEDLIRYRIERANECIQEAAVMADTNNWNTVANRLYYACFFMVGALLIKHDIATCSHAELKQAFQKEFIETGIFSDKFGKLYEELFEKLQEDDIPYNPYNCEEIEPLIAPTEAFVKSLLEKL